jgi:hemerythrin-like domain-containing protein
MFKTRIKMDIKAERVNRRKFIQQGLTAGTFVVLGSMGFICGCKEKGGEEVSPAEDLMREHGVLRRILLIYDHYKTRLIAGDQMPLIFLSESAGIIREFIEGYHEKLEEDFLFPRFVSKDPLKGLVDVLKAQHKAGRTLTGKIESIIKDSPGSGEDLVHLLTLFTAMYRPHAAREDSVLFPAFRSIVSADEYESLGEKFEDEEHKLFGIEGFEGIVEKVSNIEKQLGIYDLASFTPQM